MLYARIVLSSLLRMLKFFFNLDPINLVMSPLSEGLQVHESMSQAFQPFQARHESLKGGLPPPRKTKGWFTKMVGNSNSWTFWQSKQLTISKQMMWWGCCSIISKNKVCRDLFWESSLLVDLTSASQETEIGDIVVTQTNEDVNIMDFPRGFSMDLFWRFLRFSGFFSFPEWYSLSMFQQRQIHQNPQS